MTDKNDYIKMYMDYIYLNKAIEKIANDIATTIEYYLDDDFIYGWCCDGCCDECNEYDECDECEENEDNHTYDIIEESKEEDVVNHPFHYTNHGMECILEMVMLYGFEETMSFCKLNAHKYRKRAMDKGGRIDIDKSDWYINTYKELAVAKEWGETPLQYVCQRLNNK